MAFIDNTGNTIDSYDPRGISGFNAYRTIDENEELIGIYGH